MSTIIQQPDALNLAGNLPKFSISSDAEVAFVLTRDSVELLNEYYQPDANGLVSIDVRAVIDRILEVVIPITNDPITEQPTGVGNFAASIDGTPVEFRVLKGGVAELEETSESWIGSHLLSWQIQTKSTLQQEPEWLGIYPLAAGNIMVAVYFADGTSNNAVYAALDADKLYSVNVNWGNIATWVAASSLSTLQPVAWDVWYEAGAVQTTPVQRYQLRNDSDEEHLYVWENTLGGIDSVSFTGAMEEDQKLTHQNALVSYDDETIFEYDILKEHEIRQSTGYLTTEEGLWLKDFFYSRKKYRIRPDGSLRQISVVSSKILDVTTDDETDYEFTFRLGSNSKLLNLERTFAVLPAPEGLADFFLTDLLSGLTEASYADNLIMAVQSPYAIGWQKLSLSQLWGGTLPTLIDNVTIKLINGKLTAIIPPTADHGGGGTTPTDSRTELIDGTIIWRSGLTYNSTVINYKILGVTYAANAITLTLQPADASYGRIDLFYVDQFGNLNVQTGTPAAAPAAPILTYRQLEVMSVLILAGSLEPANVDIEKIYDEHTEWATTEEHDVNTSVDFESTDQPLNGVLRLSVGINIPDTTIYRPLHFLGEAYQGGIIFQLSPDGTKGLIVSASDVATSFYERLSGGGPYATGASGVAIGTGKSNSDLLLANARAQDQAVKYCNDLIVDGFNDWYLPSELELAEIYFRRMEVGGLSNLTRWSSTEVTGSYDWKRARCLNFGNGVVSTMDKNNVFSVRAIRSFDDTTLESGVPVPAYAPDTLNLCFNAPAPVIVKDGILTLNILSSLPWIAGSSVLLFETWLGVNRTGVVAMGSLTNLFGYAPSNPNWQLVAIQLYNFAPDATKLDSIKIRLEGSWPNGFDLGFDDIRFQHSTIEGSAALLTAIDRTDFSFVETPDGTTTVFTTLVPYILTSTKVYLNGVRQVKGEGKDYLELNDQLVFTLPPEGDSGFEIDYKTYTHG